LLGHGSAGVEQQALGDLDHHAATVQPELLQMRQPGLLAPRIVVELHRRLVDADLEPCAVLLAPALGLGGCLAENPGPDLDDQPA
jgi:hypothetical protein